MGKPLKQICREVLERSPFRNGRIITNADVMAFVKEIRSLTYKQEGQ